MRQRWALWNALTFLCLLLAAGAIPARATIRYEISLAHPAQHQFHVTMTIPEVRQKVVVQIPAWNTLYQIRDFGYHVTGLARQRCGGKAAARLAFRQADLDDSRTG